MTPAWAVVAMLAVTAAARQVLLLRRYRRRSEAAPAPPFGAQRIVRTRTTAFAPGGETGVLYVDSGGNCTLADGAARDLLHLGPGAVTLRDLLPGGAAESAELLLALERQGVVERHGTAVLGAAALDIRAVALRDRDDNFWGAALFLQRATQAPWLTPAARSQR